MRRDATPAGGRRRRALGWVRPPLPRGGLRATDGTPVLYEQYLRYGAVAATGRSVWRPFAPVLVLGLVVLAAVQIPLAWRLARRLRDGQRERERLLVRAGQG